MSCPVSVTFDAPPLRQSFGACNVVFDGVATVGATSYRVNVTATRGARKPDVTLRYATPAKLGHVVPESALASVRAAVVEAAKRHLAPMRAAIVEAAESGDRDARNAVQESAAKATLAMAERVQREAADDMGFGTETVSAVPVVLPVTSAPMEPRRDNVEYHAGRKAFAAGGSCPYTVGGERAARWNLGHVEAAALASPVPGFADAKGPAPFAMVAGRSIDGAEYLTREGFHGDRTAALVMEWQTAIAIAASEERKAAATRCPESGVYGIKATPWERPALYSLADYEADERDAESLASYLESNS